MGTDWIGSAEESPAANSMGVLLYYYANILELEAGGFIKLLNILQNVQNMAYMFTIAESGKLLRLTIWYAPRQEQPK